LADYRRLHRRGSHGERVVSLTHLEDRAWTQYVLSADDYGVMRASASVLRADNPKLEKEPLKRIEAAMGQIESVHLVQVFVHQGARFWWQADWQDFQGVVYPRSTVNPCPPPVSLSIATVKTYDLFKKHGTFQESSKNDLTAALTLTLTPTQTRTERDRVRGWFEQFWESYPKKANKQKAERSFQKLAPSDELGETMMAAVDRQKRMPQWLKDGGEFIPHASTWINGRRWEDEQPIPNRPRSLGPAYGRDAWEAECRELHDSECAGPTEHAEKMAAVKAS
jgi:hypothetical protein